MGMHSSYEIIAERWQLLGNSSVWCCGDNYYSRPRGFPSTSDPPSLSLGGCRSSRFVHDHPCHTYRPKHTASDRSHRAMETHYTSEVHNIHIWCKSTLPIKITHSMSNIAEYRTSEDPPPVIFKGRTRGPKSGTPRREAASLKSHESTAPDAPQSLRSSLKSLPRTPLNARDE